jgi:hypothetical protein
LKIYQQADSKLKLEDPRQAYFYSQWKKLTESEKQILLAELAKK